MANSLACVLVLLLGAPACFGLGSDYANGEPASSSGWPKGMGELVNSDARVHGFFVNAEDLFFFQGDQKTFDAFLAAYLKIEGIKGRKIVVHKGVGVAKSPWSKGEGVACDWKIYGCPESWKFRKPGADGYILEVHIWEGGAIKLDEKMLPDGVAVERVSDKKPKKPSE